MTNGLKEGAFIVLEGTDGSGTTTQTELLAQELLRMGLQVEVTREPSSGFIGRQIREVLARKAGLEKVDAAALALLFAADRLHHLAERVTPLLLQGRTVVSDRYRLSSYIYQSLTLPDGLGDAQRRLEWVSQINAPSRAPDITVVLDVSADAARARRSLRGGPEELFEKAALQERLVEAYLVAERFAPKDRVVHVAGEGAKEDVTRRIVTAIRSSLPQLFTAA